MIGHSMGGKTGLYYQYKYKNPTIQKMVILGAPSDFVIILKNFTSLLSLNKKMIQALQHKYTQVLDKNLDEFASKEFVSNMETKGFLAHDIDDTIVLFTEGKKIAEAWKNVQFEETKGLGHKLHDEDLYKKVSAFLFGSDV